MLRIAIILILALSGYQRTNRYVEYASYFFFETSFGRESLHIPNQI